MSNAEKGVENFEPPERSQPRSRQLETVATTTKTETLSCLAAAAAASENYILDMAARRRVQELALRVSDSDAE